MSTGISILVPTLGRPTLKDTLASIVPQASDLDQLVVIFDGFDCPTDAADTLMDDFPGETVICRVENLGHWGHAARNWALENVVTRTWTASMDDDDVYTEGAFAAIRAGLEAVAPTVHVWGCKWGPGSHAHGTVLPRGMGLRRGEIATPMVVAPTCIARYGLAYDGDFGYATELAAIFPVETWTWHDHVICEVRPAPVPA